MIIIVNSDDIRKISKAWSFLQKAGGLKCDKIIKTKAHHCDVPPRKCCIRQQRHQKEEVVLSV